MSIWGFVFSDPKPTCNMLLVKSDPFHVLAVWGLPEHMLTECYCLGPQKGHHKGFKFKHSFKIYLRGPHKSKHMDRVQI